MRLRVLAMVAAAVFVPACMTPGGLPSASLATESEAVELSVYGAASLAEVLQQAKAAYETANPGARLTIATDSSAALRTQIEQGAPADVFLSADTDNPEALLDAGLTDGEAVDFAGNRLVIVVPADSPAGIESPADLAREGVRIVAAGEEVPITTYADQLVMNLAGLAGYPQDFAARYAANVVSREDNVKAVVAKIALGEGDAGIVYVTDALASTAVAPVAIPDEANVPATYAAVVVRGSSHPGDARAFLDWLAGPGGQAILAQFGFTPPP